MFTQPDEMINEWFPSLPLIRINGSGSGKLYIGSYILQINILNDYLILDSATQNAYKDTQNKNSDVSISDFPTLQPGSNRISWDGGIASVEITPRWWAL